MKLQSFYLAAFFMCLFVLKNQAYDVTISQKVDAFCRIWIEDVNNNRIGGDGSYHGCGSGDTRHIDFGNQQYYIYAKVDGSFEKQKRRGPFDGDHFCSIHGEVDSWGFDCN
ncbi:hypothetical protein C1646_803622 [Rhizophagus diaphanus]|nr:hypothetical protein C1646_803622 [Rhizophagus diaphanus] [Rhizophagus sp. MUCL 43196]